MVSSAGSGCRALRRAFEASTWFLGFGAAELGLLLVIGTFVEARLIEATTIGAFIRAMLIEATAWLALSFREWAPWALVAFEALAALARVICAWAPVGIGSES